jgi:hypothetical protein
MPWAFGGGGAAVVAGVVVAVVLATGGDGGGQTTTTFVTDTTDTVPTTVPSTELTGPTTATTPGTTTTTPGTTFPNARESTLISHLPRRVRASCERTEGAAQAPNSITSVYCRLRGRGVYYEQFSRLTPMNDYYSGKLRLHQVRRNSGSCSSEENVEGSYNQGHGTVGRVTCYRVDGEPWVVWTHRRRALRLTPVVRAARAPPRRW